MAPDNCRPHEITVREKYNIPKQYGIYGDKVLVPIEDLNQLLSKVSQVNRMNIAMKNLDLRKKYSVPDEFTMTSEGMVLIPPDRLYDITNKDRRTENDEAKLSKTSRYCIDFAVEIYSNIRSLLGFLCILSGGVWIIKEDCSFDTFLGFSSLVICILCFIVGNLMPKDKKVIYRLFEMLEMFFIYKICTKNTRKNDAHL